MKKVVLFLALMFLVLPIVSSIDVDVELIEKDDLILKGLDNRATFTLDITNNDETGFFEIFSLVGVSIFPKEPFLIQEAETKTLEIEVLPHEETRQDEQGNYIFEYQIKNQDSEFHTGKLTIRVLELSDAIEVGIEEISLNDEEAKFTINNKENFNFEDLNLEITSEFFDFSETLSLDEKQEATRTAELKDLRGLPAGEYKAYTQFSFSGVESSGESNINYLEKSSTASSAEKFGLIVVKDVISETNEGNVETLVTLKEKRNIITRLLTTFSENPDTVERSGFSVNYEWERQLVPGEEYEITVTTNYTLPFFLIILIILVGVMVKFYTRRDLQLQKRVSFVKTRGGEFALKVRVSAKANSDVEDIKIKDRLPRLAKLYEKFGTKPDKIDEQTRSLYWAVRKMSKGEERVFTYVIYSKVNIVGRFELPAAAARFTKDGKTQDVYSNTTAFAREDVQNEEE